MFTLTPVLLTRHRSLWLLAKVSSHIGSLLSMSSLRERFHIKGEKERLRVLKSGRFHETMSFATTWMDLEIIIPSGINQTEKDKHHGISYSWNLKYDTNEFIYGTETDSQT